LFVCAGGVIHSKGDSQDIHFMVGLLQQVQQFLTQNVMFNFCHNNSLEFKCVQSTERMWTLQIRSPQ